MSTPSGPSDHPASSGDPAPDRVAEAVRAHPRAGFLPAELRSRAAEDRPLPIGHGQTSSQPSTVVAMLRLLDVPRAARVLDVGAGSGWTTALLAHLVGPRGTVVGVELTPELARWGAANLASAGQPWARLLLADDGMLGRPDEGPFDRILVSAESRRLPQSLVDQLAPGGRMVAPVDGQMLLIVRHAPGPAATEPSGGTETEISRHGAYRFVPLR